MSMPPWEMWVMLVSAIVFLWFLWFDPESSVPILAAFVFGGAWGWGMWTA